MKRIVLFHSLLGFVLLFGSCRPEETGELIHDVPAFSAEYYQQALKATTEIIDQYPDNPDGYYQKSRILEALGNPNNAILNLKKAVKLDSGNALYHKELARLFLETGKHKRAEEAVQVAWQLGDRTASTLSILTQVHAEQGSYAQAMNYLNKALETEPSNSQLVFEKGKLYLMQGDTLRGKEYLEQHLKVLQNQPEFFELLANLYRTEKNYSKALSYLRQSLVLQPEKEALHMQAVDILLEAGRLDSAQLVLHRMQRKKGERPELMLLIGRLHVDQNKPDSAEYYFNRALALDSRSKEAYFWLGKLYAGKRQYFTAREQYRNALLIDTTYQEAQQALLAVETTLANIERWKQQQAEMKALPTVDAVKPKGIDPIE